MTFSFGNVFPANVKVLVIDHDIHLLNAIEKKLSQFNYQVTTCWTVSSAMNLIAQKVHFDLVLLETQMPDMDSFDFLQQLTQQIDIPVIMTMCSEGSTTGILNAIENGACDCWVKPFSENQVKYMWHHAVRKMMKGNKKQKINEQLGVEGSQIRARDDSNLCLNDEDIPEPPPTKKTKKRKKTKKTKKERVVWSLELHEQFMKAVKELDASSSSSSSKAVPKTILEHMKVPGLTREQVGSHLQVISVLTHKICDKSVL
ncbi:putative response regulator and transcription factor RR-A-type family [Medicago truncatula]|uniref:Putative response regulator and transcription factor RR-A-type family n=1 Tax=Medicago truncatula TaxID=3880 RepID=A0A396GRQ7_MEDTR|nr:putative response regulator and transcription factor RR-A-type family [Medicago truncatula]